MRFVIGVVATMLLLACSGFSSSSELGSGGGSVTQVRQCPDGGKCRYAFVSAKSYAAKMTSGDKVGTAAADELCRLEAVSAGLAGAWVAWISDKESDSAITRVGRSDFYLVDGTMVLSTSSGQPAIAHAINIDPFGAPLPNELVWTSTSGSGTAQDDVASSASCSFWTSGSDKETAYVGTTSPKSLATQEWTVSGTLACNQKARLYCFAQ